MTVILMKHYLVNANIIEILILFVTYYMMYYITIYNLLLPYIIRRI